MRRFLALWSKEFTACFLSPIAYVTLVAFLILSSATFMVKVLDAAESPDTASPIQLLLLESITIWITLLVPVVAMRIFAEETRSGTAETLLTAPVRETEIVWGKFFGAFSFLALMIAPAFGFVWILDWLSPGIQGADPGGMAGGALILALLCAFWLSIGLLASLVTSHQIIAAITAFFIIWLTLLAGWILTILPLGLKELGNYISATDHIQGFAMGSIDSRPVVLYVTATFFTLFVCVRVLESRRWR